MLYAGAVTFEWGFMIRLRLSYIDGAGVAVFFGVGSLYWRLMVVGRCGVIRWHEFRSVVANRGGFWVVLWW